MYVRVTTDSRALIAASRPGATDEKPEADMRLFDDAGHDIVDYNTAARSLRW